MKGIARDIMLVAMFIIAVYFIMFYLKTPNYASRIEKMEFQQDLNAMKKALDLAKLYAETSLRYSVYQACYDNLRAGGVLPAEEEFKENLKLGIENNLKVYTSEGYNFLTEYRVTLPEYEIVIEEFEPLVIRADSKNGENLWIEKTTERETIKLEKSPLITETLEVNCYEIYQKGLEKSKEVSEVLSQIIGKEYETNNIEDVENEIRKELKTLQIDNEYLMEIMNINIGTTEYEIMIEDKMEKRYKVDEVGVTIKIKDMKPERVYPVYTEDGKIEFSPMELIFLVK
jgi:hypothetical protein